MSRKLEACAAKEVAIDTTGVCGAGSGCEGFVLSGAYTIMGDTDGGHKVEVSLALEVPDGEENTQIALGWALDMPGTGNTDGYLTMAQNYGADWGWNSLSGQLSRNVAWVSQSPRSAYLDYGVPDSPVVWVPTAEGVIGGDFSASARRAYAHDDLARVLSGEPGSSREFTACFFTLKGRQGCTRPQAMSLAADSCGSSADPGAGAPSTGGSSVPAAGGSTAPTTGGVDPAIPTPPAGFDPTLTPEEEAVVAKEAEIFANKLDSQNDGLAEAMDELAKLREQGNKIAVDDDVSELVIEVGELDPVEQEETPAVRKARIGYLKALNDYQQLKARQDWSQLINLPRTDYYKDTEAIQSTRAALQDAEDELQAAKDAHKDFVDGFNDNAFDVSVEDQYLLDMQKAYDDWLKAKAGY